MTTKRYMRWSGKAGLVLLCLGVSVHVVDAQYVILPNGQRVDGQAIRSRPSGEITLTLPGGAGTRTFMPGQYVQAVAPEPPELARAIRGVEAKQYDQAIAMLEDIVRANQHLHWDLVALGEIGKANVAKGDHATAVRAYDRLFQASPDRKKDDAFRWGYYQALLGADQHDKLETELNELAASGARGDAARAQVMRGDIKLAKGLVEPAVMDYLRTAVLFERETAVVAEATFKAAQGLEQLRDPRAKDLYRRVAERYPTSPYAAQARPKM